MSLAPSIASLADDSLRELAEHGVLRSYPKGAIVIHEGESGDSMYVIVAGRVKIYVADERGHEMVIDTLTAGEFFGEMALDSGPRTASVMCLEPSSFAVVSGNTLRDAIVAHPDFALRLISTLIARARLSTDLVKNLALLDVYGRVAGLILKQAVERDGKWVVGERLTQQEIAARVGSSRDMITRIFRDLVAGGYVAVDKGQITILRRPPARW